MNDALQFSEIWDGRNLGLDLPGTWNAVREMSQNPRKILEVGSFEGFSACKMIELFAPYNPLDLTCIDTWDGAIFYDQRVGSDHESRFHRNLEIARQSAPNPIDLRAIKADSCLALSSLITQGETETFDWIYLDGSHDSKDVLFESVAAFKLLKSGGILVFDDYGWDDAILKGGNVNNTPKPAIDAFVNIYFDQLTLVLGAPMYQLYLRKNERRGLAAG